MSKINECQQVTIEFTNTDFKLETGVFHPSLYEGVCGNPYIHRGL